MEYPIKLKRERRNKNKKWSSEEEVKILNFLLKTVQQNQRIEKPTAKQFWQLFQSENKEFRDLDEIIIRNKARNLKSGYLAAVKWKNSTGQGFTNEETIQSELSRICRHYNLLDKIYSKRPNVVAPYDFDSEDMVPFENANLQPVVEVLVEDFEQDILINENGESSQSYSDLDTPLATSNLDLSWMSSNRKRPSYEENSIQKLTKLEESKIELLKKRLKLEEDKFHYQKHLDARRFKLKEHKLVAATEMKKLELEHEKEMKILDNQKEIEIARMELEFKYGQHSSRL